MSVQNYTSNRVLLNFTSFFSVYGLKVCSSKMNVNFRIGASLQLY